MGFLHMSPQAQSILVFVVQVIGIAVPLIGIVALVRKDQNRVTTNLMLANSGCLIMNGGYLLTLQASGMEESMLAYKMTQLGNSIFYYFFLLFVLSYLRVKYPKWLNTVGAVAEAFYTVLIWSGDKRRMVFTGTDLKMPDAGGFYYMGHTPGVVYIIRNSILAFLLAGILLYSLVRFFRVRIWEDKGRIFRLLCAQIIVMASLIWTLTNRFPFDIAPICAAIAVMVIILSVIKGEFFSITDIGREWVFEHTKDLFVIVDSVYGFLDANAYARNLFPQLEKTGQHGKLPEELYHIFVSEENEQSIEDRCYERTITPLEQDGKVVGYSLMLFDTTERHRLMEELKVERDRAEEACMAKSAFMSNISHEIRTPMNAIIGLTEVLLRGKMSEQEQGYLTNIRNSGMSLLNLINDILDFSKAEAGKLDLVEEEYEPMSMLSDLSMTFLSRIGNKNVELLFDIDKDLPARLYGDSLRLRQIITNLMTNAIKYTDEGYVKLTVKTDFVSDQEMKLSVFVKDTGMGIREEDMSKLFQEFQQVDVKKNHEKEGTGLGLSIAKQLVHLMGGEIGVRSVYGQGSEFFFVLPQKNFSTEKAAQIHPGNGKVTVSSCMKAYRVEEEFKKIAQRYGLNFLEYDKVKVQGQKVDFLFLDDRMYREESEFLPEFQKYSDNLCVLQNPLQETIWDENVLVVNKPLYSLNFCHVINQESQTDAVPAENEMDFTAPDAEVLIVEDNEINRKVALVLLEPLQMKMDTAVNGQEALEKIRKKKYDLIFMDHMMPVMDGIEATEKLRAMDGDYYRTVPVIALTANAVEQAKEQFKRAGMNDFVAKPIEIKKISAKIKRWLPKEKVIKGQTPGCVTGQSPEETELPVIEGLDVRAGIANAGSEKFFYELLRDFYRLTEMKATKVEQYLADCMLREYTVEVHALKSTARMIGALELSEQFRLLEQWSNEGKLEQLQSKTPEVLAMYRGLKTALKPYSDAGEQEKEEVPTGELIELFEKVRSGVDTFDLDATDKAMERLEHCRIPEACQDKMELLRAYVADVAMEQVLQTTGEILEILNGGME